MLYFLLFLVVVAAGKSIETSKQVFKFYRNDYDFTPEFDCLYKFHTLDRTWADARAQCQAEGAELAAPDTANEAEYLHSLLSKRAPDVSGIFLGIHSQFAKGYFVSLRGVPLENIYHEWQHGEPNNYDNLEACVAMTRDGKLNDVKCDKEYPYICKKLASTLKIENDKCKTYDIAYEPTEKGDRCYKFHTEPKTWKEAYMICKSEGSYLAVMNSEEESNHLVKKFDKVSRNDLYGLTDKHRFIIGFHDMLHEGEYRTIFGQSLKDAGFVNWCQGQPDNYNGKQNCGAILHDGTLDDIECDTPYTFVCEREIKKES
uniref:Immulectin1 n=1 Tax=Hepialus xiaojinensis TaxID=1589740 RepID=A0A219YXG9_9NEOP|nr:immulectin1 [Hepialus xiaojinensis]